MRQPSISGFLSGKVDISDHRLARLLSCMGFRLEVVRRPVVPQLTRSERRSWLLHLRLSTLLNHQSFEEGVAGEFSPFEELHGFSIDGVDLETSVLPDAWRDRLVKVQYATTAAPPGEPRFTGWRLDKSGPCVAKLAAFREKDRNFVAALLEAKLVNADLIPSRLPTFPGEHIAAIDRALHRLNFNALRLPIAADGQTMSTCRLSAARSAARDR